jgi:hypothetical protein
MKYLMAAALSAITLLFTAGLSFAQQQETATHNRQTKQSTASKPGMPAMQTKNQPMLAMKQGKAVHGKAKKALAEKEAGDNNQADSIAKLLMRQPALSSVNTPLIMLDNRKISTADFLLLDSSKVASMSVLKVDAAISAYGTEGRNGAILITSK